MRVKQNLRRLGYAADPEAADSDEALVVAREAAREAALKRLQRAATRGKTIAALNIRSKGSAGFEQLPKMKSERGGQIPCMKNLKKIK
jgi:hypothetical protein